MSDPEISAAAAAGAAAAVTEVQDRQAQEAVTELAAGAAAVAAEEATVASQQAADASATADVAVSMASEAQSATETLAIGLTDVYERVGRVETKQEEFITEARGFFTSLQERQNAEPAVQKVEVTHNASDANTGAQSTGKEQTDTGSGGGTSQTRNSARRHRFGR